jgi:hypothetical protein
MLYDVYLEIESNIKKIKLYDKDNLAEIAIGEIDIMCNRKIN